MGTSEKINRAFRREQLYQHRLRADGTSLPEVHVLCGSQTASKREASLAAFRRERASGDQARPRMLIATGRALRGLELATTDGMPLDEVVFFDFPPDTKAYLSRIGCATRGDAPPARVTALAEGSQLAFAKALLAHDSAGSPHSLHGCGLV